MAQEKVNKKTLDKLRKRVDAIHGPSTNLRIVDNEVVTSLITGGDEPTYRYTGLDTSQCRYIDSDIIKGSRTVLPQRENVLLFIKIPMSREWDHDIVMTAENNNESKYLPEMCCGMMADWNNPCGSNFRLLGRSMCTSSSESWLGA